VQMMLDGHSAESVAANLGISSTNLLYRWKASRLKLDGPAAALDSRVRGLQEELRRVERERDVLPLNASILPVSNQQLFCGGLPSSEPAFGRSPRRASASAWRPKASADE
jgi:transposase-like protein